jgi:hypothetical protein
LLAHPERLLFSLNIWKNQVSAPQKPTHLG